MKTCATQRRSTKLEHITIKQLDAWNEKKTTTTTHEE